MKKLLALVLALVLLVTLAACAGAPATPAPAKENTDSPKSDSPKDTSEAAVSSSQEPIYVSVSCAITGDTPQEGEYVRNTVQYVIDQFNADGGVDGRPIELIIEDDGNTANTAVNVMEKTTADQRIVMQIGPHRSASVLAVETIAKQAGMPFISGGTSKSFYSLDNPYLFRGRACDSLVASIAAKYAIEELGATTVGMIHDTDDYGTGAYDVIAEYVAENYPEVTLIEEGITTGAVDMTGPLLNMANAGVTAMVVYVHDNDAAILARQYKELGLDASMKIVGCSSFANSVYYDLLEEGVGDGIYVVADVSQTNPDTYFAEFQKAYTDAFGVAPETMAAAYHDIAKIACDAIKRAAQTGKITRESVRNALADTSAEALTGNQGSLYVSKTNGMDFIHQCLVAVSKGDGTEYIATVYE